MKPRFSLESCWIGLSLLAGLDRVAAQSQSGPNVGNLLPGRNGGGIRFVTRQTRMSDVSVGASQFFGAAGVPLAQGAAQTPASGGGINVQSSGSTGASSPLLVLAAAAKRGDPVAKEALRALAEKNAEVTASAVR